MASTSELSHIVSTLVKVWPPYFSRNFPSASARVSAAAVTLMYDNAEIGGRICVLATPSPAMPRRRVWLRVAPSLPLQDLWRIGANRCWLQSYPRPPGNEGSDSRRRSESRGVDLSLLARRASLSPLACALPRWLCLKR